MAARTYTDEERAEARALAVEEGLAEAHRRLGIPKSTIISWMTPEESEAMAGRSASKTREATAEHRRSMERKRVEAQAEYAESMIYAARMIRQAENGKDAHGWAMASGTALDKLRLELGEVTERIETVDARERATTLVDELAQRRERRAA